ncbi:MAG: Anti-sigma-28 factor, FlgM [Candidatus Gallionella acididurans]|uniref:Negative regulator of flagellin synthesis n=1 Tax=Candidatus Gallionella acididurans TaxID=1796491 RepID=A0A139BXU0_9PROT|nr:MAG: Anti-sigma-28 factor, FlgM [Candidatus Gallionella acididurans]
MLNDPGNGNIQTERIIVKIDKPGKPLPVSPAGEKTAHVSTGKANQPVAPSQSGSTSVSLGTKATQLQSMESSMANSPVANPNKVAEIKQAISEGRFTVNSGVVADKLIETVKELIRNKG